MLEAIKNNFSNENNQLIIQEISKQYHLSSLEYISLINILMYYYSISANPNTIDTVQYVCSQIIKYREKLKINQTNELFDNCLSDLISKELKFDRNSTINNLEKLVNEGLVFHSFNAAFFDKINQDGLIVKEKPWNLEDIEKVRKIFQNRNKKNIFGLYQGREATPIFFANTLATSPYYSLSSPTFFRKFIENKPEYFNVFLNRDFDKAKQSIIELCTVLNEEERKIVYSFFNKYWELFTNNELPYIAISTKEALEVQDNKLSRLPSEPLEYYYLRCLLSNHNYMFKNNIDRNKLQLFSYKRLTLIPSVKEKSI